jgi:hypothetical protein
MQVCFWPLIGYLNEDGKDKKESIQQPFKRLNLRFPAPGTCSNKRVFVGVGMLLFVNLQLLCWLISCKGHDITTKKSKRQWLHNTCNLT